MAVLGIIIVLVILYLAASIRVLRQYERGVIFNLGKFAGVEEPGITLVFVPFQRWCAYRCAPSRCRSLRKK